MIRVNLIPQQRRAGDEARRRRAVWIRFLRFYACALAFACALSLLPARAATPSLESAIARATRGADAAGKSLADVKSRSAVLARQIEVARIVGDHPDWSRLLAAVAAIFKHPADDAGESQLRSFDLSIAKVEDKTAKAAPSKSDGKSDKPPPPHDIVTVKLKGVAPSLESCIKSVKSLENLRVFDQVTLKDTHPELIGKVAATQFEIEAAIDCGPILPDKSAEKEGGK